MGAPADAREDMARSRRRREEQQTAVRILEQGWERGQAAHANVA